MPQTMTQLSLRSRTTSSSYSFQPSTDSSIWTWPIIDASSPRRTMLLELLAVVGDAAADAAERERGTDDRGQADLLEERARLVQRSSPSGPGACRSPTASHDLPERFAVLGAVDHLAGGADHLDAEPVEHAFDRAAGTRSSSAVCPPSVGSSASIGVPRSRLLLRGSSRPPPA